MHTQTQLGNFFRPQPSRFSILVNGGAEPCKRCQGQGKIQRFAHVDGGICFWCNGSGKQ